MTTRFLLTAWLGAMVLTGFALGAEEEQPANQDEKPEIFVGAGVLVTSKPYEGVSSKVYPIPLFGYEGKRLYLRGITGGYRLLDVKGWSIGPTLRPSFGGYEADDSSALRGMDDRDVTLEGGIDLACRKDWGLLGITLLTDLLGAHDGQKVELSYTALFPYAGFTFIPGVGVQWQSSDVVDYYYGVRTSEARPGRAAYEPDDALIPLVRLAVRRELTQHWGLLFATQYEWFDSEISDSPIIEDDGSLSLMLGATYTF